MDVPALLIRARGRAGLTRPQLAAAAGTSTSALSAYERGIRSPTVATLDRLLAGCGLQVRPELEPHLADLDAEVDRLLQAAPPPDVARLAEALDEAAMRWAFDGSTALALQGLAADGGFGEVVAAGDDALRRFAYRLGLDAVDCDGRPIWRSWLDLDLTQVAPTRSWTRFGPLTLRVAPELPVVIGVEAGGRSVPVLPLWEVEQAHPALAAVLGRLRHRRTVSA